MKSFSKNKGLWTVLAVLIIIIGIQAKIQYEGYQYKKTHQYEDTKVYKIKEEIQNKNILAVLNNAKISKKLDFDIIDKEAFLKDQSFLKLNENNELVGDYVSLTLEYQFMNKTEESQNIELGDLFIESKDQVEYPAVANIVEGKKYSQSSKLIHILKAGETRLLRQAFIVREKEIEGKKKELFTSISFDPDNTENMNLGRKIKLDKIEVNQ